MRLWKSEKVPEKRAADVFPFYEKPGRGRRRRRKQRRLKMLLRLRLLIWRSICQIKLTFLSRGKVGRIFKARPIRKSLRQIAPVFFSSAFDFFSGSTLPHSREPILVYTLPSSSSSGFSQVFPCVRVLWEESFLLLFSTPKWENRRGLHFVYSGGRRGRKWNEQSS